jgi:predicted membrane channel-forming protein YqfA (hemolysin III family)
MSRSELIQKLEGQKKFANKNGFWLLLVLAIFVVLFIWLSNHEDVIPESFRPLVLVVSLLGGFYGILAVFVIRSNKQMKESGLHCPQCKKV